MKKVIALSTVLALGALGMACGETAPNANTGNTNKPANTSTPAPATPAATTPMANVNAPGNANKPADKPGDDKKMESNANANKK